MFSTLLFAGLALGQPPGEYVKKGTRAETVVATLAAFKLPNLIGQWHIVGPFDNHERAAYDTYLPVEKGPVDLKANYPGWEGKPVTWKKCDLPLGKMVDIKRFMTPVTDDAAVCFYTEFESAKAFKLPLSVAADDTVSIHLNGERVFHINHESVAEPDQYRLDLRVKEGKNTLLIKVCQYGGGWDFYLAPEVPDVLPEAVRKRLDKDFPPKVVAAAPSPTSGLEAKHYAVTTLQQPDDCVLEVGGLGIRPDGKLMVCTRRGELWLVNNPSAADAKQLSFTRYATGLHESLGLWVQDDRTTYVIQRPELTRVTDTNGDGRADTFQTVSDQWGVSGDYHEYAFGPARNKDGSFFITLNVGFGGGHQAKSPWRGWCVRVDPKTGEMEPWAYGLRSPNGINFSPDGELFYTDNQGEWVATNKMHHLKKGKFYGHQAGLLWVKHSPFAGVVSDKVTSGMWYDGQPPVGKTSPSGKPAIDPPCIWFPYGRMGQSVSEPVWDTTGKFGPFAGQCFVGDQTKSMVMRVALEKVNGVWQGACFPFRSGLQCGVNRLCFGPDGSLYVGQTNRGWGSVGGKPYGLQRINFTGEVPLEVHTLTATPDGFELKFTKHVDPASLKKDAYEVKSFTYAYTGQYGYPETDTKPEKITAVAVAADGKGVKLTVPDRRTGRVFEFGLSGVKTPTGEALLHTDAYYTLNELPK